MDHPLTPPLSSPPKGSKTRSVNTISNRKISLMTIGYLSGWRRGGEESTKGTMTRSDNTISNREIVEICIFVLDGYWLFGGMGEGERK